MKKLKNLLLGLSILLALFLSDTLFAGVVTKEGGTAIVFGIKDKSRRDLCNPGNAICSTGTRVAGGSCSFTYIFVDSTDSGNEGICTLILKFSKDQFAKSGLVTGGNTSGSFTTDDDATIDLGNGITSFTMPKGSLIIWTIDPNDGSAMVLPMPFGTSGSASDASKR